jgi:DnaK suppressor protein
VESLQGYLMDTDVRAELKQKINDEIELQMHLIASLTATSKPVSPDNAIGRLTRMEAIISQNISEASLKSAQAKLANLKKTLSKLGMQDFGVCVRCEKPIPHGRIMLMPESILCVSCLEKK